MTIYRSGAAGRGNVQSLKAKKLFCSRQLAVRNLAIQKPEKFSGEAKWAMVVF